MGTIANLAMTSLHERSRLQSLTFIFLLNSQALPKNYLFPIPSQRTKLKNVKLQAKNISLDSSSPT